MIQRYARQAAINTRERRAGSDTWDRCRCKPRLFRSEKNVSMDFPECAFGDLCANAPERRHFAAYLTGLMIAGKKTVSDTNREFVVTTDQIKFQKLSRASYGFPASLASCEQYGKVRPIHRLPKEAQRSR